MEFGRLQYQYRKIKIETNARDRALERGGSLQCAPGPSGFEGLRRLGAPAGRVCSVPAT